MDRKIIILNYQDNFADDFSVYAYGNIFEKRIKSACFYENTTSKRLTFEKKMKDFNLDCYYLSKNRTDEIFKKHSFLNYKELDSKNIKTDKIINLSHFKIDDIPKITDELKTKLDFKNTDFIVNYDILEEITETNSIGLYISPKDKPDFKYIENACKRLNKYLKKPVLYVFGNKNIDINLDIKHKFVNLVDYREEFYFLKKCKNKIIHCTKNSYSEGFWASVLNNYNFSYVVYDKKLNPVIKLEHWIKA